ncbi:MAG: 6,7-dimethyl-8-ribityllumazine synthase [Paludibacteraceae bacterium]|nr:6,7-dimethyl-8-ribityllumazine synthase [Paludibacteraceae bacterium]MBR5972871.1 6,7-dimethyl-8-ribityllumazine synthase [Paludibacteraceae bacterium]
MATVDLSKYDKDSVPSASEMTFGIVVSDWNSDVTFSLLQGARETLIKHGADPENICEFHVPGSFELVYASKRVSEELDVDAVIALGCVVRGGTPHFDYVCQGTTNGLSKLNTEGTIPFIFGLLTTDDMQQSLDRAGGKLGNKGVEAAITAIKMVDFNKKLLDY